MAHQVGNVAIFAGLKAKAESRQPKADRRPPPSNHHGRINFVTIQTQKPSLSVGRASETCDMRDVSVIEINLSDLDHNMRTLRSMVGPECGICPIVKADGYGLGAARIAKRLVFGGADLLAVYTPEQAAELFRAAIGCKVLILMPVREIARVDELYRGLISDRLQLTVHDNAHVSDLISITERYGVVINVHLEIDTGMSRGGCAVEDAPALLQRIATAKRLHLAGVFSHFVGAENDLDFTQRQLKTFERIIDENRSLLNPDTRIHIANSFGLLRGKAFHQTMVRIGLAWAGYGIEWMNAGEAVPQADKLRPIVTWKSRVVQVKTIEAGTPVGYGSAWTSKRRSMIGLVPVGYADGYPIALGNKDLNPKGTSVGVVLDGDDVPASNSFVPVVGAVNMDQITIDLTDVAAAAERDGRPVGVGTLVELISPDVDAPNHLPTLARMAGTIPHEMLCRLNPRLKRVYLTGTGVIESPVPAGAMAG